METIQIVGMVCIVALIAIGVWVTRICLNYSERRAIIKNAGKVWHTANVIPKEEGEYIVIGLSDIYGHPDVFHAEYRKPYGWCYEIEGRYVKIDIKWWSCPPGKEK